MSEYVVILTTPTPISEGLTAQLLFFRGDAAVIHVKGDTAALIAVRVGDRMFRDWFVAHIDFDALPSQPSHLLRTPTRGVTLKRTFEAEDSR